MDQLLVPLLSFLLYSPHLSARFCVDIVRRNSVLVTHGSERVKEENRGLDSNIGKEFKLKQTVM